MLVIVNLVIGYGIPETYLLSLGMFTMTTYVFYSIDTNPTHNLKGLFVGIYYFNL